ncbi:MAG: hypothetical protein SGILL_005275 [Bacillariaceae sp.]
MDDSVNSYDSSGTAFTFSPPPPSEPPKQRTVLEEIREVLAQSYLIFLISDLRLMSGTGRICTKYENLAIDSDVYPKNTAAQLACMVLPSTEEEKTEEPKTYYISSTKTSNMVAQGPEHNAKSLSPANIMAILLLEIRDTFVSAGTDENKEVGQVLLSYREDKVKRRDLEDSMNNLLRAYARMISEDLVKELPSVRRRRQSMVHSGISTAANNTSPQKPLTSGSGTHHASPPPMPPPEAVSTSMNAPYRDSQPHGNNSLGLISIQEETSVELATDSSFFYGTAGESSRLSMQQPIKATSEMSSVSETQQEEDPKKEFVTPKKEARGTPIEDKETHQDSVEPVREPKDSVTPDSLWEEKTTTIAGIAGISGEQDDIDQKESFHSAKSEEYSADHDDNKKQDDTTRSNPETGKHGWKRPPKLVPAVHVPSPQNPFSSVRREHIAHQVSKRKDQLTEEAKRVAADIKQKRDNLAQEINDRVDPNRERNTQKEFQELTEALFEGGKGNKPVAASISGNASGGDMLKVMRSAVETRDDAQLQFLGQIFKEGSVSQLLVQSASRLVWMNDWYPLKDLTYGIAVDTRLKRVLVVFRGAITTEDWRTVMQYKFETIRNPVKDNFEGKKDKIRVYTGIYDYLFRVRKDTGTTKYSEIASLAHKYGVEKIGNDYKLFVTGHSLGGALTNFFCFFASCEERFTRNGPVQAIAFAGPYCGGHSFADAFRHQERNKKVQLVRVTNNNDMVPRLPTNFRIGRRGCRWRHVGIGVTMPRVPWFGKWKPLMHYYGKEKSWLGSTIHGYQRNFLFHAPLLRPWIIPRMHTLFELQDRLMYGEIQSNPGGDFTMLNQTMEELYAGLEENDFSKLKGMKTRQKWV